MTTSIPKYSWLTNEYFEEILRRDNEAIVVKNVALEHALAKGEHYGSDMLRANVEYTTDSVIKNISFVIKSVTVTDPGMEEILRSMGIFQKEITIYQKILPEVERLLHSIGDFSKLVPK